MNRLTRKTVVSHAVFVVAFLLLWEYTMRQEWLPATFFGQPSGIAAYLWDGFVVGKKLWLELGYTIAGTIVSFLLGSSAALTLGLVFVMFPTVEKAMDPYLMVLNAMPRFALAPLFLLWFGLGIGSKIAVGTSLSFFIVLANTVAGIRGVSQDLVILSRSLGATPKQVFFKVTLPGEAIGETGPMVFDVSLADLLARFGFVVTKDTPFAEVLTVTLPRALQRPDQHLAIDEFRFHAQLLQHRADLRAAAVHDHGVDAGLFEQHDVAGEFARLRLVAHRVAAVFHHDGGIVVAQHVRQRLHDRHVPEDDLQQLRRVADELDICAHHKPHPAHPVDPHPCAGHAQSHAQPGGIARIDSAIKLATG